MAFVILDAKGTYSAKGVRLRPGANEIDDPDVLAWLALNAPDCVTIQEDRRPPKPEESEVPPPNETPEEPYVLFEGRDGKWYFHQPAGSGQAVKQSDPYDTPEEAAEAADAAKEEASLIPMAGDVDSKPETGVTTSEDLKKGVFECRGDGCDKTFPNSGARVNHERVMHPDLGQQPAPEAATE